MNKYFSFIVISFFSFLSVSTVFSQSFTRTIELKNPRMNGQDVVNLQKRLLALGFFSVGEADGYYGPLSAEVVKNVQTFSGFNINGTVNKNLWDYIFNERNSSFLKNVSIVLTYNPVRLMKSRDLLYTDIPYDAHSEAFVYYSSTDKKAKILEYYAGNPHTQTKMTCYFINDNYYFVQYSWTEPRTNKNSDIVGSTTTETIYLVNNNNLFEMESGVMKRADYDQNHTVIEPINDILIKFMVEYR